jgi:hypothetical protein
MSVQFVSTAAVWAGPPEATASMALPCADPAMEANR